MKYLLNFIDSLRIFLFVTAGIVMISILVLPAQTPNKIVKIKTFVSKDGIHPGEGFKVAVSIKIKRNWHIHATDLQNELLIPTKMIIEEGDNVSIQKYYFPDPKSEKYEYSESVLQIYDEEILFGAVVETAENMNPGQIRLNGSLKFQACDDTSCLPPTTLNFQIEFKVVPPTQETKDINQKIFTQMEFEKNSGS